MNEIEEVVWALAQAIERLPDWVADKQNAGELLREYEATPAEKRAALLEKWKAETVHINSFTIQRIRIGKDGIRIETDPGQPPPST